MHFMSKSRLLLFFAMLLSFAGRTQTITGPGTICSGTAITYAGTPAGGTWSVSVGPVLTVNPATGQVVGMTAGSGVLTYTLPSSAFTTIPITVLTGASMGTSGPSRVCVGGTITHVVSPTGGTWSISPTSVASVSGGSVLGLSAGIAAVTYTVSSGCTAVMYDTIVATPSAIGGSLVVCTGTTSTLTNTTTGGTWVSATPAVATVNAWTGVVTGITVGTTYITYNAASGCSVSAVVTVSPSPTVSVGSGTLCVGATTPLTVSPIGGVWTSSSPVISISMSGIVTGVSPGTATITYAASSGCSGTTVVTVVASPSVAVGTGNLCLGSPYGAAGTPAGGIWTSSDLAVFTVASSTGIMTPVAVGTAYVTYTLPTGCNSIATVTVNPLPVISASSTPATCGNTYTLTATGGSTYVWSSGGLSCSSCASPVASPTGPVTYTVTGYSAAGCAGTPVTVTLSGNRIYGHINFSSATPASPVLNVWLIQFNPADSSITATDSVTTCMDGSSPYYHFDSKPAGNYLVKARLNSAIPGTSDYIPTYGASTPNWYAAATITHASATNVQDINMLYGTVPSGPGFISGYVYSGAGKGTASDIPVEGMIVFLKNTAGDVLTYTYTDALGAYSFGSLAYGSYVIYPAEQAYYTTPSAVLTLSATLPSAMSISFKQYTTSGVILPFFVPTDVRSAVTATAPGVYPNPATDEIKISIGAPISEELQLSLTDITGRIALSSTVITDLNGQVSADITGVVPGMYVLRITSGTFNYTGKLMVK